MCIENFWIGINVEKEKLVVDSDNMISIYMYIIIKNRRPDIMAHVNYINDFTT
jgi:hypothetical protein